MCRSAVLIGGGLCNRQRSEAIVALQHFVLASRLSSHTCGTKADAFELICTRMAFRFRDQ